MVVLTDVVAVVVGVCSSRPFVRCLFGVWLVLVWSLFGACEVLLWFLCGVCVVFVWFFLVVCAMFTSYRWTSRPARSVTQGAPASYQIMSLHLLC